MFSISEVILQLPSSYHIWETQNRQSCLYLTTWTCSDSFCCWVRLKQSKRHTYQSCSPDFFCTPLWQASIEHGCSMPASLFVQDAMDYFSWKRKRIHLCCFSIPLYTLQLINELWTYNPRPKSFDEVISVHWICLVKDPTSVTSSGCPLMSLNE